jgi:hypothetical protein
MTGRQRFPEGWEYDVAQWFPRMAVYDDVRGWNTEQYLGSGEFYLEYGDIDYAITTPAGYTVTGSGVLTNAAQVLAPAQRTRLTAAVRSDTTIHIIAPNEVGSPALGICLDTGHAILESWDNAEAVRVAGDLLIALHIADNDGSGDQHRTPYSYGSQVDWPSVVAALRALGYDGVLNLEIPGERGRPLAVLDAAMRYALDVSRLLLAGGDTP